MSEGRLTTVPLPLECCGQQWHQGMEACIETALCTSANAHTPLTFPLCFVN